MKKYIENAVNENMTRDEERDLAIEILDDGFFWLNNTMCKVYSIERNERHYFINYEDIIGTAAPRKSIIVSQLRDVGSLANTLTQEEYDLLRKWLKDVRERFVMMEP